MEFLDQKLSKPTFRDAQSIPLKKETIFQVVGPLGMSRATLKDNFEVFILSIHIRDTLKSKYLGFKGREQEISPRKCIGPFVHLAGFVVDHKMEGLHELYPLGMSWIELMLSLDELQSLMIRVENEFSPN